MSLILLNGPENGVFVVEGRRIERILDIPIWILKKDLNFSRIS